MQKDATGACTFQLPEDMVHMLEELEKLALAVE